MNGLYVVGLTGNIATGKSTVAAMLKRLGARVLDADVLAHQLMQPGAVAYDRVVAEFGVEMLQPDGAIDRKRLGARVFADVDALARLEAIVHPAVIAEKERLLAEWQHDGGGHLVVVEAIKLIESGMHRQCDELWVVTSPREQQVERLMASRGLSKDEAELRVDAQSPQIDKAMQGDVVIANDGSLEQLADRVTAEWGRVSHLVGSREGLHKDPQTGGQIVSWRKWMDEHPFLMMWAVLSVGMVTIFALTSRDVPLLWNQRLFMATACVGLAALCTWIVSWE